VSCNYLSTSAPVLDVEISIVHDIPTTVASWLCCKSERLATRLFWSL